MSFPPRFSIHPAQESEIKTLAAISEAAMTTDKQTEFKHLAQDSAVSSLMMEEPIKSWLTNPKLRVLKAVDDETSEILGWTCWAFRGYDTPTPPVRTTSDQPVKPEPLPSNPVDRLNRFTGDDFAVWMEEKMPPGTKCMFICSISVHPKHQGRGVGKALIRWGTSQADRDEVFCWVHASEAGYPVFKKEGYEVDKELPIDLDEYAKDVEIEGVRDRKWGVYTLRYLIRQPRKA